DERDGDERRRCGSKEPAGKFRMRRIDWRCAARPNVVHDATPGASRKETVGPCSRTSAIPARRGRLVNRRKLGTDRESGEPKGELVLPSAFGFPLLLHTASMWISNNSVKFVILRTSFTSSDGL